MITAEDYARESKEAFWNAHAYGRVDGVQNMYRV